MDNNKIVCSNIWKLFGPDEKRVKENLDPNLSIKEVQEKTGHVVAVKNVSFSIQKGETFVVMGLSGSGKSTLANVIMGHPAYKITSGTIMFKGVPLDEMEVFERARLRPDGHDARLCSTGAASAR